MKMNESHLRAMAEEINRDYFEGTLDIEKINFSISGRMTKTRGLFSTRRSIVTLKISKLLTEDYQEVYRTMAHELIHYWQYTNCYNLDHSYSFKRKASEMNRKNPDLMLARTTRTQSTKVANAIQEKRTSSITNQFVVIKGGRVNFLKNISLEEINTLLARGYTVEQVLLPDARFRHCRNLKALFSARYYYHESQIAHLELKEVK